MCWETVFKGLNRTNNSLSGETLLGAWRQNFSQTEDDLRMTMLRKYKVHHNNLNRM